MVVLTNCEVEFPRNCNECGDECSGNKHCPNCGSTLCGGCFDDMLHSHYHDLTSVKYFVANDGMLICSVKDLEEKVFVYFGKSYVFKRINVTPRCDLCY